MAATTTRSNTMPMPSEPVGAACAIPPPGERSQDFTSHGVKVSQKPPTQKDLERIADFPVLDEDSHPHAFRSLYDDKRYDKVLILFVRHFFCGNCQEFLRTLSAALPPSSLPPRSTIAIIGHGSPDLIAFYRASTSSPYTIYADPSKRLYAELGMARTLSLGPERPDYIGKSFMGMVWSSMVQNLGQGRKALRGGDLFQQGGEMLFERRAGSQGNGTRNAAKEWSVTWCHRMGSSRDHAGMPAIGEALGVVREEEREARARGSESSEDDAVRAKREAGRPGVKKRWTMHEVGSGVRRSLSVRNRAWSRSRSRSRVGEQGRMAAAH